MYRIEIVPSAVGELKLVPVFYRRLVETAVDKQLMQTPSVVTKNRKCLKGVVPGFEFEEPLWELRVDDWRVFYDIDEDQKKVIIRAVRQKPKGKTTEEII